MTAGGDETPPGAGGADRAFFGRRKGKRLRVAQEERLAGLLPRLRIGLPTEGALDPASLFPEPKRLYRLEIGFGGGEHLAHEAATNPDIGYIGAEPFLNGVVKLLALVEERGLRNVRVHDEDVTALLAALPPESLDRVDLLYPDPWPKRRQRKRRFVSDASLSAIARALHPGGRFRFASDIDDYAGWVLVRAARSPALRWTAERADDWRRPYPGWPGTRYEAKAEAAGRVPTYLEFERA
ncbi:MULTISPECIES: tRNA (guanine(46)-N(7))-methyltransferase TrmB [Methylobacterium]|uniref:tRNA (guanine-N(7)-)-methyltransferase n=1 Tax=Methylobacterium jeotgali TaxID=381630 RepID=A0ABQ4SZ06_9HYPH|nr:MULTISPECIES: tRNA (guanine(46)-N(7))-methyltransferase TrmB [Methylobacterium]PIU06752.1 MAG: tRNA (guanosine(46)-N7)-methyltransferase TrmB [Methylobacterium sp. CG09_land_8_20_14_0_10_71_15]PIU14856.1 MAG: tRNA (guanosine(46)-N7)-methyltransferase TrmB [Methylobacterium sp. CG08_land_8_20_14_0_20_71_15]GBU17988.1 tRNA m(7)G46 methyltransferase [Methylobacterium sp.]GJE07441.1 tRNA (guanine-N(7)-)-methyltransferase [Methylobacterium jeotgali]